MSRLELLVPPPVVVLITAALMWTASFYVPAFDMPPASSTAVRLPTALAIALAGIAFDLAGLVSFRRARTTVNPMRPSASSALVTSGVYRLTRNPMYFGLLLLLTAWAVFLSSPWLLAGPLAFVLYMNRFQIGPEERALSARFADSYTAYRRRVRRWI
jgi:protein-S-isoprenylcysteine O-methyltransferase Ste14